ncbi:hypothetical protein M758_4G142200 [Ceratodon purpureus]|nr:hypothetical protein M758_4G142200 [Ceratodon purpureus]
MALVSRLKTLKQTANLKKLDNAQFNIQQMGRPFAACSSVGLHSVNDCEIIPSSRALGESSTRFMHKNGARTGGSEFDRLPVWLPMRGKGPQGNNLNFARFHSSQCAPAVPRERVECVVVGAGVVGLAVARELASAGREVWVIEGASDIGTGTSSRNSEVIHAGLHYPQGSLKAKLCVEGKDSMYAYCQENGVPYKRVGKLIVATQPQQVPLLEKMQTAGEANGVHDLRLLEATDVRSMEPELQCVKALWSPSSGILDTHTFMSTLQADAEEHGASFAFNTSMLRGAVTKRNIELHVGSTEALTPSSGKGVDAILCANYVVNATGLYAQSFARKLDGLPADSIPASHFARGCYFSSSGVKSPFSHLIYPIPEDGGLGCHVTLDLGGQVRFGPDVEWLPELMNGVSLSTQFDYSVDPKRADRFYSEIRKYYPSLADGALQPSYSGIRPKLSGPGQPSADFLIQVSI